MDNLFPRRDQPRIVRDSLRIHFMYSAQLLDHFQHPRNAGDVPDADAIAEIENPVCGDVIRMSLKIREGRIVEIRFKAKGCVPALACGSALTELSFSKTPADACKITPKELSETVGGLPPASNHAAELAIDVLQAALKKL